jgi:tetratricopeptide (TPR) repeat protein
VRPFAQGYSFPTVVDDQAVLTRLLDADVVPNGILLDAAGRVRFRHVGGFDVRRADVLARVEGLLDELAADRAAESVEDGRAAGSGAPRLIQRAWDVETLLTETAAAPDDADLQIALAELHARDGDHAAALAAYDRAVALAPGSSAAHFGRGTTLARLGRTAVAEAAWIEALRRDPANFVVRKQIWAHRHPEKFWPEIDAEWQRAEMAREQAGQSDLPPRPD